METPGDGELIDGWWARWTTRERPSFTLVGRDAHVVFVTQPVLLLRKDGFKGIEVTGESEIDRDTMLARGMKAAMLCEFHLSDKDPVEAVRLGELFGKWEAVEKVRHDAMLAQKTLGRMGIDAIFRAGVATASGRAPDGLGR